MKRLHLFLTLCALLLLAAPVQAQLGANSLTINPAASGSSPTIRAEGLDANISITITPKGTGTVSLGAGGLSTSTATLTTATITTANVTTLTVTNPVTKSYFVRAVDHCRSDNALLITTRLAQSDWALARTAGGAETYNITCNIPLPIRTTAAKGIRIDSFAIAQQITVAALTSNTFGALATVTYVNNVANAIAGYGGAVTITMPTATQANPYVTAATLGTPAFQTTDVSSLVLDWTAVMQNTGVYRLYGVQVVYSEAEY